MLVSKMRCHLLYLLFNHRTNMSATRFTPPPKKRQKSTQSKTNIKQHINFVVVNHAEVHIAVTRWIAGTVYISRPEAGGRSKSLTLSGAGTIPVHLTDANGLPRTLTTLRVLEGAQVLVASNLNVSIQPVRFVWLNVVTCIRTVGDWSTAKQAR